MARTEPFTHLPDVLEKVRVHVEHRKFFTCLVEYQLVPLPWLKTTSRDLAKLPRGLPIAPARKLRGLLKKVGPVMLTRARE